MAANDVPCCEPMFWTYLAISIALVAFSGLMSGLTLGLMSLSLVDLEVLIKSGLPEERKNAEKILPIVKNQHLLLCTLLIGNALAMEALPIFVDALLPAWGAILVSVTIILAFGEIIPQAICTRYGLSVGAKLSVVVRIIVIVLFPLAYPISKLLDSILGKKHLVLMRRAELRTLVGMHGNEAGKGGELSHDETTIITGALDMTQKTAKDAMTPISMIFSLDINDKLDEETMELLISKGHSRVPIYSGNPTNIIGLILVKNLIKCHGEDDTPIRDLTIRTIPRVHEHLPLYDILNQFQKGNSHMAVVVKSKEEDAKVAPRNLKSKHGVLIIGLNPNAQAAGISHQFGQNEQVSITINSPSVYSTDTETRSPVEQKSRNVRIQEDEYRSRDPSQEDSYTLPLADEEVVGIITLEDVIEELLQEEILDETDEYVDVHNKIKVNMLPPRRSTPVRAAGNSGWSKSPFASPASSYHHHSPLSCSHTPILQSPIPPYAHSPLVRPTLTSSPRNSNPSSPSATTAAGIRMSPSSHRVSRKAYEKLRRPNGL